jgi:hypothetical protein
MFTLYGWQAMRKIANVYISIPWACFFGMWICRSSYQNAALEFGRTVCQALDDSTVESARQARLQKRFGTVACFLFLLFLQQPNEDSWTSWHGDGNQARYSSHTGLPKSLLTTHVSVSLSRVLKH